MKHAPIIAVFAAAIIGCGSDKVPTSNLDAGAADASPDVATTNSNPGKVTCSAELAGLECPGGFQDGPEAGTLLSGGCCVDYQADGTQKYACTTSPCSGTTTPRWFCDEASDCGSQGPCCLIILQFPLGLEVIKTCSGNGACPSTTLCKSSQECPNGSACSVYTCRGNVKVQACSEPTNCK